MTVLYATNDAVDFNLSETTTAGRFDSSYVDSAIELPNSSGQTSTMLFGWPESSVEDTWIHFDILYGVSSENASLVDGFAHSIFDGNGNRILFADMNNYFFTWEAQGSSAFGAAFSPNTASITTYDFHINRNDATDLFTLTVYVNGAVYASTTYTNASHGRPVSMDIGGNDVGNGDYYVSQILVQETSTLGRKLADVRPAGVGNADQWTQNHTVLGDSDFATVTSTGVVGNRMSSTLSAWGGPTTGDIEKIVLRADASESGGGANSINQYVRFGGTNYDGANIPLTEDVVRYYTTFDQNPNTAVAWTFADLASLEIGLLAGA